MKKSIMTILMIIMSTYINAEETKSIDLTVSEVSTESKVANESSETDLVVEESVSNEEIILNVDQPVGNSIDELTYLDFAKNYLGNKQPKNSEELLWQLSEFEYGAIRNNDFQYMKIKDEKIKEYKETIKNSEFFEPTINISVVVGNYDFSRKIWPIKNVLSNKRSFFATTSQSLLNSSIDFFPNGVESKVSKDNDLPSMFYLKISDIKSLKELRMNESSAEKVSNNLSSSREVVCTLKLVNPKTSDKRVKDYSQKNKTRIETTYSFSSEKLKCFEDNLRTKEIALN